MLPTAHYKRFVGSSQRLIKARPIEIHAILEIRAEDPFWFTKSNRDYKIKIVRITNFKVIIF